jgi:hypothetical protein
MTEERTTKPNNRNEPKARLSQRGFRHIEGGKSHVRDTKAQWASANKASRRGETSTKLNALLGLHSK